MRRSIVLILIWFIATPVFAQDATISGRVLRRGVVPMAHAHVTYTNSEGGATFETLTDSTGSYSITSIPLSASPRRAPHHGTTAMVANSVGSSRSFYFAATKPLRRARVYDLLGRTVATVDLNSAQSSGLWISAGFWNGTTASGVPAANGIYFASTSENESHVLKFIHLREGQEGSPPLITASVLQALGLRDNPEEFPRGHTSLDDAFTVTISPDAAHGPRFTPYTISRVLHEGDNGLVVDTVWSAVPHSILFVGNSYTYVNGGVDVHLRNLFLSAHPDSHLATSNVTVGGYTLGDHFHYAPTLTAIDSGNWDAVVLQEQSERPVLEPDSFYYFARLLNAEILRVRSETAFYMTWARQYDPPMIEPLAAAYDSMGCELGALVGPCGRAFQRSIALDSTINLYQSDGSHPSVWGTYLVCCVFYATLMQQSPVGLSYVNDPLITDQQRLFLQTVAWDVVNPNP